MGDGINDAPALHVSDVGISVDSAVDIAKAAAAVILLEKDLMVLDEGVIEGRKVFVNILKYIRMGASSNFRQHVQRSRGERVSALYANGADPGADE
jgi:Mg2+-importing ATPase